MLKRAGWCRACGLWGEQFWAHTMDCWGKTENPWSDPCQRSVERKEAAGKAWIAVGASPDTGTERGTSTSQRLTLRRSREREARSLREAGGGGEGGGSRIRKESSSFGSGIGMSIALWNWIWGIGVGSKFTSNYGGQEKDGVQEGCNQTVMWGEAAVGLQKTAAMSDGTKVMDHATDITRIRVDGDAVVLCGVYKI